MTRNKYIRLTPDGLSGTSYIVELLVPDQPTLGILTIISELPSCQSPYEYQIALSAIVRLSLADSGDQRLSEAAANMRRTLTRK